MSVEEPARPPSGAAGAPTGPPTHARAVAMTLLGLDWGARRIGLAIKPAGQDWPLPQATLTIAGEAQALEAVREAISRSGAGGVVVGLPLGPDPQQAREIKRFCRKARARTAGVRWFFVDERLTTQAADALGLERSARRPTDDLAAALILETFLQSCR